MICPDTSRSTAIIGTRALTTSRTAASGPLGAPAGPLAAVRDVVRARVPMMAVDREVSGQIVAVDELIPAICETAGAHCGGLK